MQKKPYKALSCIEKSFKLQNGIVREIIKDFHSEMSKGLAGRKSSLAMLPTYVSMPTGSEKGRFIALDLGGTNFRILEVMLKGHGKIKVISENRFQLREKDITGTGGQLFNFIAESIKRFMRKNKISFEVKENLGFTFSFPVKQTNIAKGILLCWNKGFSARNAVGKDVVQMLDEAIKRKGISNIKVAALINDTIGTLVAKRYSDRKCDIGVIFGTGTNASYPEKISKIRKLPELNTGSGYMAINIEWGNFNRLPRTIYDRKIDILTTNPGRQRLEKMVSGLYLGEIARTILFDLVKKKALLADNPPAHFIKPWDLSAKYMSEMENDNSRYLTTVKKNLNKLGIKKTTYADRTIIKRICGFVLNRSAKISASAIAAVIIWMDPKIKRSHTVAIDGSLFEKCPGYRRYLKYSLRTILKSNSEKISLALAKDGSGKGAAIVAATIS